jgi:hypothetical protein
VSINKCDVANEYDDEQFGFTPIAPQAAKPETPMPAKLREVAEKYVDSRGLINSTWAGTDRDWTLTELLADFGSEVRAQAMEECAAIVEHETGYQSQYAHGIAREPMRAMGRIISEAIRASGKE